MKKLFKFSTMIGLAFITLTSCQRSTGSTWEDTKTLGRYLKKETQKLFGNYADSKMIYSEDEFLGPLEDEYIPLNEKESKRIALNYEVEKEPPIQSAKETHIPGLESFKDPRNALSKVFKTVHFHTDDHVIREKEYLGIIDRITGHLKKNNKTYVFVLGHCDQRASRAYNLALGTRRANHVRTLLIKKGIDPNHVFTISMGKETPLDDRNTKEAWAKNRRVEFKIYEKNSTTMR